MPSSACQTCALRSEEHTSELQSHDNLVCRLLLDKKNHRCPASCSRTSAARCGANLCWTSASVSVRSSAWKVNRSETLTEPAGTPLPWYRSKNATETSGAA